MAATAEGISLVLTVAGDAPHGALLSSWRTALQQLEVPYEIIVVSTCEQQTVRRMLPNLPEIRWEYLELPTGVGGCLRAALPLVRHPFLLHLTLDYPYSPAELKPMWERIHLRDEYLNKPPDLVNGCRNGRPAPLPWRLLIRSWQLFWRIFSGFPRRDLAPWYGPRAEWLRWLARWVYGIPLHDPFSGCKLYRTEFLRRFPIQSGGPFVHVEIAAKATFLTSIVDEVVLRPQPAAVTVPSLAALRSDCWRCLTDPQFTMSPTTPPASTAPANAPV